MCDALNWGIPSLRGCTIAGHYLWHKPQLIFSIRLGAHFSSFINTVYNWGTDTWPSESTIPRRGHVTIILSNFLSVKWLLMPQHFIKDNCCVASVCRTMAYNPLMTNTIEWTLWTLLPLNRRPIDQIITKIYESYIFHRFNTKCQTIYQKN